MSRFNKWLPFFEQSSERRDVASWHDLLSKHLASKGLKILSLVTDRAKALVKLAEEEYLNTCSMPDCFHFQQDISKLAGLQIGKKHQQAQASKLNLEGKTDAQKQEIEKSANEIIAVYKDYRKQTAMVNKIIHPFDESNNWSSQAAVNKSLIGAVRQVSKLAENIQINIDLSKATKALHQIPNIAEGISNWIGKSQSKIKNWLKEEVMSEVEKIWFTSYLLPFLYWKLQLSRTKNGRTNQHLVDYYENRVQSAKTDTLKQMEILNIPRERQDILAQMAYQMASSFQRSSSQVEGRNGYLAFIHHGQKGIPKKKIKALSVIHNFDTKRSDGSTPAQRLFKQEFPDLFEFLYQNVTGFKEPRKRKPKPLNFKLLQS